MKKFLIVFLLILGSFTLFGVELVIYYTSSLNGNIDGCNCASAPKAGLVKRAAFLRKIPDRKNTLLIDTGDIFSVQKELLLADKILAVYRDLGYDLVSAGDQEMLNGTDTFLYYYCQEFPFVCHNLKIAEGENWQAVTPEPLVLNKAGLKIGILAVLDPKVFFFYPDHIKRTIEVTDPDQAVTGLLKILKTKKVDLTLLLFHGYLDKGRQLAEKFKEVDVIIAGHDQNLVEEKLSARRILLSPGEEGNRLGKLVINFSSSGITAMRNSFRLFSYADDPDDPAVRQQIVDYVEALQQQYGSAASE